MDRGLVPGVRARLVSAEYPKAGQIYGYHRYVGCDVTVESLPRAFGALTVVDIRVHDDELDAEVEQTVETRHLQLDGRDELSCEDTCQGRCEHPGEFAECDLGAADG